MNVNILYEHDPHLRRPHGCSHIRLLRPLNHPSLHGKLHPFAGTQLSDKKTDVVIVERWWKPDLSESEAIQLVKTVKARGTTLIYTLDDNLLDIGLDEEESLIPETILRATRHFIQEAHGVIVSTPALKERLKSINSNIIVIPNALDEQLFLTELENASNSKNQHKNQTNNAPIVIGYMGTKSHGADLQMLIEPLKRIFNKYGNKVQFEIIGICNDSRLISALSPANVRILDPGHADQYDQFVHWFRSSAQWDIGLAPLTNRSFNNYKSDIKFLDYGILGIPGIFSDVGPYPNTVDHEKNGILVENSSQCWFEAISRMIDDEELRRRLGTNAASYVKTHRLLKTCALNWYEVIQTIHATAHSNLPCADIPLPIARNEKVLYGCNLQGIGLEIGASYSPIAPKKSGIRVEILDHADATTLKEKYQVHNVDVMNIEEVDYVWSGEPLHELTEKENYYDWIVASHVIEHTPDFVSFLRECEIMLKPGGLLCLAVPDHRYCFDVCRPASTPGDVIQAYIEKRRRHSFGAIWDHFSMIMRKGDTVSWFKGHEGAYQFIHPNLSDARTMLTRAQESSEYIDVHNWRFTPSSFKLIMNDIGVLGYTSLSTKTFFETEGCEFIIQLQKGISSSLNNNQRNDLIMLMLKESLDLASWDL